MENIQATLQFFAHLYEEKIKTIIAHYEEQKLRREYQSKEIDQLATALAKAQAEMNVAVKDKTNPFFKSKYADWEAVASASFPALNKNGLSLVMSLITEDNGETFFDCCLMHNSGQWKKSYVKFLPPKTDIQANMSYNTSLKRLVVSNLLGVIIGDEDDDGNKAVGNIVSTESITHDQAQSIENKLKDRQDLAQELRKLLRIDSFTKMKKETYTGVMKWIEEHIK